MDDDIEIFKGKKFSDLCKDIYDNSAHTRAQVEILISELRQMIKGVNDAITVVPLIKDYMSIGVKNDDQLVKLAAIVQRVANRQATAEASGDPFALTEEEKQQIMQEVDSLSLEDKNVNSTEVEAVVAKAKQELESDA